MFLSGLCADGDAIFVIGFACAEQDPFIAGELCAHFEDDALGALSDGGHGEGGEEEGEHGAYEHADEDDGVRDGKGELKVEAVLGDEGLYLDVERGEQCEGGEHGGADGEAFARGGGGIAEGVEGVGASADGFVHAGHLGDAARVVGDGAVGVGGECDAEGREHTDGGDADAEHAVFAASEGVVRAEDGGGDDEDGREGGEHAEGGAVDDDGACAALRGFGEFSGRGIGSAGEKLGKEADEHACGETDEYGNNDERVADCPKEEGGRGGGGGGGEPGARAQGAQELFLACAFFGADEEGSYDGEDDADGGDPEGNERAEKFETRGDAECHGREEGADVRFIEVCAHACDVSDVVSDVVGDDGGVAAVVFGDIFFDFPDEVCADVGGFGEDAAPDARKERHAGCAHAEGDHVGGDKGGFGEGGIGEGVKAFENKIPDGEVAKPEADHDEAHDASCGKGGAQSLIEAVLGGGGGAGVGGGGDLHAQKARKSGEETAGEECEGHERPYESDEGENAQEYKNASKKDGNHDVLPFQKGVGAFAYDRGNAFGLFAFGHFENFPSKNEREKERQHGGAGCDQNRIFHCFPLQSGQIFFVREKNCAFFNNTMKKPTGQYLFRFFCRKVFKSRRAGQIFAPRGANFCPARRK